MNKFKGWRTVIINGATLVIMLGALATGNITDPTVLRWITIGVASANVIMRWVTTTSVGKSE